MCKSVIPMRLANMERHLLLLLLPTIGCLHRSSEASLLRPLASVYSNGFPYDSVQPQYLAFADPLTASILKNLVRNGRYQIAPKGAPVFCPADPARGNHGYMLALRVRQVMGDSALVAAEQMCATNYGIISTSVNYLLRKRGRRWEVVQPISGGTTVPSGVMVSARFLPECFRFEHPLGYSASGAREQGDSAWYVLQLDDSGTVTRPLFPRRQREMWTHRSGWTAKGDTLLVRVFDGLVGWDVSLWPTGNRFSGSATYLTDVRVEGWVPPRVEVHAARIKCTPSLE
jgi:hypothetical protein